jgi:nucleotide-binding universal stress UspA family protein
VSPIYSVVNPPPLLDEAYSYLERIAGPLRSGGLDGRILPTYGVPVTTILEVARERSVDLIALATQGRSGVERFVLGSVATGLVQRADVPVLLTHPNG